MSGQSGGLPLAFVAAYFYRIFPETGLTRIAQDISQQGSLVGRQAVFAQGTHEVEPRDIRQMIAQQLRQRGYSDKEVSAAVECFLDPVLMSKKSTVEMGTRGDDFELMTALMSTQTGFDATLGGVAQFEAQTMKSHQAPEAKVVISAKKRDVATGGSAVMCDAMEQGQDMIARMPACT